MNAILSRKMAEQMPISRHFGAIDAIARSAAPHLRFEAP
jgi:hypothetical protein